MKRTKYVATPEEIETKAKAFTKFNNVLMAHYGLNTTAVLMHLLEMEEYFRQNGMLTAAGEFFQKHKQISEKFKLSVHQIRKANKQLVDDGVISTHEKRTDYPYRKLYYKVNHGTLQTLINTVSTKKLNVQKLNVKKLNVQTLKNSTDIRSKIKQYNQTLINQKNNNQEKNDDHDLEKNGRLIHPNDFDYLWKSYPRKLNEPAARKAFNKLCQMEDRPTFHELRQKLRLHKKSERWTKSPEYIPWFKKWIEEEWQRDAKELHYYTKEPPKEQKEESKEFDPMDLYRDENFEE